LKDRLLIVEDDEDIANVLSIALSLLGYQVKIVAGATEASRYLADNHVDLVITDWMLDDGSGADVCAAARAKDSRIPLIVISAVIGRWDMRVVKSHSNAHLKKPIDMTKLRLTVNTLLNERQAGRETKKALE
jgi:DNA-binding response OmpR family regulator